MSQANKSQLRVGDGVFTEKNSTTSLKTMPTLNDVFELKKSLEYSKRNKLKFDIVDPIKRLRQKFDKFDNILYAKDFDDCKTAECDGKWITGTENNDLIFDGTKNDDIYTFPKDLENATWDLFHGNDLVIAGEGSDQITGDCGQDTVHGGNGNDSIYGWKGNDFLNGGKDDDNLNDGSGDDTLLGGRGDDTLGDGKRTLALINGADAWTSDNDYVDGGKGNDLIKAFDGNDILIGGIGVDAFSISNENIEGIPNCHIIRDFEIGEVVMFVPNAQEELMPRSIEVFGRASSKVINANGESLLVLEGVMPDEIHLNNDQINFAQYQYFYPQACSIKDLFSQEAPKHINGQQTLLATNQDCHIMLTYIKCGLNFLLRHDP